MVVSCLELSNQSAARLQRESHMLVCSGNTLIYCLFTSNRFTYSQYTARTGCTCQSRPPHITRDTARWSAILDRVALCSSASVQISHQMHPQYTHHHVNCLFHQRTANHRKHKTPFKTSKETHKVRIISCHIYYIPPFFQSPIQPLASVSHDPRKIEKDNRKERKTMGPLMQILTVSYS